MAEMVMRSRSRMMREMEMEGKGVLVSVLMSLYFSILNYHCPAQLKSILLFCDEFF